MSRPRLPDSDAEHPDAQNPNHAPGHSSSSSSDLSSDSKSCLTLYLREIGKVKLLTPQEEIHLAARVQAGDKKAREKMIKANLRLVVKIARDYEHLGLPLLDLISEGNIGLMKAVERFNPQKGAKLSTYGSWWIKQSMKRALANQSKTIRLPVHMVDKISRLNRAARQLSEVLGREPSDEELASETGHTPFQVAQMRVAANRPLSLDAPMGDVDSATYGETIEDQNAEVPLQMLQAKATSRILMELVAGLSQREASILRGRFGLDGSPPKTLDQLAAPLGLTRERVRQIQNKALLKLQKLLTKLDQPAAPPLPASH